MPPQRGIPMNDKDPLKSSMPPSLLLNPDKAAESPKGSTSFCVSTTSYPDPWVAGCSEGINTVDPPASLVRHLMVNDQPHITAVGNAVYEVTVPAQTFPVAPSEHLTDTLRFYGSPMPLMPSGGPQLWPPTHLLMPSSCSSCLPEAQPVMVPCFATKPGNTFSAPQQLVHGAFCTVNRAATTKMCVPENQTALVFNGDNREGGVSGPSAIPTVYVHGPSQYRGRYAATAETSMVIQADYQSSNKSTPAAAQETNVVAPHYQNHSRYVGENAELVLSEATATAPPLTHGNNPDALCGSHTRELNYYDLAHYPKTSDTPLGSYDDNCQYRAQTYHTFAFPSTIHILGSSHGEIRSACDTAGRPSCPGIVGIPLATAALAGPSGCYFPLYANAALPSQHDLPPSAPPSGHASAKPYNNPLHESVKPRGFRGGGGRLARDPRSFPPDAGFMCVTEPGSAPSEYHNFVDADTEDRTTPISHNNGSHRLPSGAASFGGTKGGRATTGKPHERVNGKSLGTANGSATRKHLAEPGAPASTGMKSYRVRVPRATANGTGLPVATSHSVTDKPSNSTAGATKRRNNAGADKNSTGETDPDAEWIRNANIDVLTHLKDPREVVETLERFAAAHKKHVYLFNHLESSVLENLSKYTAADLSHVCHSFVVLGFLHESFVEAMGPRVVATAHLCTASQLTRLLDAYASLRLNAHEPIRVITQQTIARLSEFSVTDIMTHASSFARLNIQSHELFSLIENRLLRIESAGEGKPTCGAVLEAASCVSVATLSKKSSALSAEEFPALDRDSVSTAKRPTTPLTTTTATTTPSHTHLNGNNCSPSGTPPLAVDRSDTDRSALPLGVADAILGSNSTGGTAKTPSSSQSTATATPPQVTTAPPLFSARDLTLAAYSFAKLGFYFPTIFSFVARNAKRVIRDFTAQQIQMVVVAFQRARVRDIELFRDMSEQAQRRMAQFNAECVALLLRSFSLLDIRDEKLFTRVVLQLPRLILACRPLDVATYLTAFARINVASPAMLEIVIPHIALHCSKFSSNDLQSVLHACAKLGANDTRLLDIFVQNMKVDALCLSHLISIMAAFGKLGFRHLSFLEDVQNHLLSKMDQFTVTMTAQLYVAMLHLNLQNEPRFDFFMQQLSGQLASVWKSYTTALSTTPTAIPPSRRPSAGNGRVFRNLQYPPSLPFPAPVAAALCLALLALFPVDSTHPQLKIEEQLLQPFPHNGAIDETSCTPSDRVTVPLSVYIPIVPCELLERLIISVYGNNIDTLDKAFGYTAKTKHQEPQAWRSCTGNPWNDIIETLGYLRAASNAVLSTALRSLKVEAVEILNKIPSCNLSTGCVMGTCSGFPTLDTQKGINDISRILEYRLRVKHTIVTPKVDGSQSIDDRLAGACCCLPLPEARDMESSSRHRDNLQRLEEVAPIEPFTPDGQNQLMASNDDNIAVNGTRPAERVTQEPETTLDYNSNGDFSVFFSAPCCAEVSNASLNNYTVAPPCGGGASVQEPISKTSPHHCVFDTSSLATSPLMDPHDQFPYHTFIVVPLSERHPNTDDFHSESSDGFDLLRGRLRSQSCPIDVDRLSEQSLDVWLPSNDNQSGNVANDCSSSMSGHLTRQTQHLMCAFPGSIVSSEELNLQQETAQRHTSWCTFSVPGSVERQRRSMESRTPSTSEVFSLLDSSGARELKDSGEQTDQDLNQQQKPPFICIIWGGPLHYFSSGEQPAGADREPNDTFSESVDHGIYQKAGALVELSATSVCDYSNDISEEASCVMRNVTEALRLLQSHAKAMTVMAKLQLRIFLAAFPPHSVVHVIPHNVWNCLRSDKARSTFLITLLSNQQ